jgi:alpha-glucosidase
MFVRAGAIVSLAPAMQFTGERPWDPLTLEIWPLKKGTSSSSVYEDDGASNDYLRGRFRTTSISVSSAPRQHKVTVKIAPAVGSFAGNLTKRAYVLRIRRPAGFPPDHHPYAALVNGRPIPIVTLAKAKSGMPFQGAGPAPDADLTEIRLPARSVSSPQAVEIMYKKKR